VPKNPVGREKRFFPHVQYPVSFVPGGPIHTALNIR